MNRHRALAPCLSMDLFGKPLHTLPDHALVRLHGLDQVFQLDRVWPEFLGELVKQRR